MLARPASLWGRPDFLRLWCGQFVSEFGSQVTLLALPLAAILVLHASTIQVATLTTLEFSPYLFFALAAGALVDRLPRRPVMVVADIGRAALLGSVPLAYAFDALTLPQLYAVGFAAGTLTVFFGLAYQAYLPQLVERERLLEANGKLEAARSVAQTGGPGAGGGLVALFSAPGAILADAISFVVSALLITSIRHSEERPSVPEKRDLRAEVDEGIRYVWRQPVLRANLFSSGLANFAYGAIWALLLVFAVRRLGLHAGLIGVILALGQGGGILGAVFAGRIAGENRGGPDVHLRDGFLRPRHAADRAGQPEHRDPVSRRRLGTRQLRHCDDLGDRHRHPPGDGAATPTGTRRRRDAHGDPGDRTARFVGRRRAGRRVRVAGGTPRGRGDLVRRVRAPPSFPGAQVARAPGGAELDRCAQQGCTRPLTQVA